MKDSVTRPAAGPAAAAVRRDSILSRLRSGRPSIPLALPGVASLALLLRLPNLTESLWFDELWATRVMLGELPTLWTTILLDTHPPVYSGLMFLWITLFGDSELSIRLPPLIFGVGSVALTYLVGPRYVSRTATVLACLLLALSPVHIWYSQEARPYSAAVCLVLLAVFAYHKLEESPRSALWSTVYFGSMWSAVLTHLYVTAYLALISAICLRSGRVRSRVLSMNVVIALSLASFLFVKHHVYGSPPITELSHLRPFTPPELWMLFFNWFSFGNAIWSLSPYSHLRGLVQNPVLVIFQIIFSVVFARGLVRVWRESRHSIELLAFLFLLPLSLMAVSLIGFGRTYIERSLLVVLPYFYLGLAEGVTGFRRAWVTTVAATAVIGVSTVALVGYFSKQDVWTVYKPNPDWRSAARYLDSNHTTSETSLLIAATPATELLYYGRGFSEAWGLDGVASLPAASSSIGGRVELRYVDRETGLCGMVAARNLGTFYVIKNEYWLGSVNRHLEELRGDGRCRLDEATSFKGLGIYRFTVP